MLSNYFYILFLIVTYILSVIIFNICIFIIQLNILVNYFYKLSVPFLIPKYYLIC
jgi:hypothetical protein